MTDDDPPEYELFADGPMNLTSDDFEFEHIATSTLHIDFEAVTAESIELENVTPEVYDELDATPNEDLRAFVEGMRVEAEYRGPYEGGDVLEHLADELEDLIEGEDND